MPHTQKEIFEALNHSPEATAIYNNSDIRIAYVNLKMLEIWDQGDDIIGKNFGDVFPEFRDQGFDDILRNVWLSGTTYIAENRRADVKVDGVLTRFHFDFQYKALQKDGVTYAILHTAKEVSDRMAAWDALAEKERVQHKLNEELAASNEEIQAYAEEYQAINEKLSSTLDELGVSYSELQATHDLLASTEDRAMYLLEQAPVAIGVYDVLSKSIRSANLLFKELWQLDEQTQIEDQPITLREDWQTFFDDAVQQVLHSQGEDTIFNQKVDRTMQQEVISSFHNLAFEPIKNKSGQIVNVMIIASEVTDQKLEKDKVDLALEQARLAKKASGFGVFDFDLSQQVLTCDERCREVMVLDAEMTLSYQEDFLDRIHLDDLHRVQMEIRQAFELANINSHLNTTFRLRNEQSSEAAKWIQLFGQVYYDRKGVATRFIGTISDVTAEIQLRLDLEYRERKLQESNEELAATMEELAAANEELLTINEELARAQQISDELNTKLQVTYDKLVISEERLEVAVKSSQLGVWDVNFLEQTLEWDARAKQIFGLAEGESVKYESRWDFIHPEDLEILQQSVEASKSASSKGIFSAQFRTHPDQDGKYRWVQLQGQVYFLADQTPVRFAGTVVDITEKVVSQQQIDVINQSIAQKEIEQRMIVDSAKIGTYSFDPVNRIVTTNKYFRDFFFLQESRDIWTDSIFLQQVPHDTNSEPRKLIEVISTQDHFDVEFEMKHPLTGFSSWLRSIGRRIKGDEQQGEMIYGIVLDITLQKNEEKRKMDFLGIVSHELKSPLTSLSGYIQILETKSRKMEDPVFGNLLSSAARQNARMRGLIEGFLDVARIGEGKLTLKRSSFDASSLISNIEQTYLETINTHQLNFNRIGPYTINADQDKIEQVIINFVNNAIKYAPGNTLIKIDALISAHNFEIRVTDQGPGISQENQAKLFSRFFRVDNEHTKQISGFGIGLYISHEIIKLHSGEIGIESELGNGATFWFRLPLQIVDIDLKR